MSIFGTVLIVVGLFFTAFSALGLLRLPDFFTRVHAVSKNETLGITLLLLGLIAHEGASLVSLKLALIAVFVFIANPVGAHVLTRAALRSGLMPWTRETKPATESRGGEAD